MEKGQWIDEALKVILTKTAVMTFIDVCGHACERQNATFVKEFKRDD